MPTPFRVQFTRAERDAITTAFTAIADACHRTSISNTELLIQILAMIRRDHRARGITARALLIDWTYSHIVDGPAAGEPPIYHYAAPAVILSNALGLRLRKALAHDPTALSAAVMAWANAETRANTRQHAFDMAQRS